YVAAGSSPEPPGPARRPGSPRPGRAHRDARRSPTDGAALGDAGPTSLETRTEGGGERPRRDRSVRDPGPDRPGRNGSRLPRARPRPHATGRDQDAPRRRDGDRRGPSPL